jgi:hypothetical protein
MDMTRRVLSIVQNLPVPFDRRVWLECQALVSAGYRSAVVPPEGRGDPSYHVIDGAEPNGYRPCAPGGGRAGSAAEYASPRLAAVLVPPKARRSERLAVIQARNPSGVFWPPAIFQHAMKGARFGFDHHGLYPEFCKSRFPGKARVPFKKLYVLERRTRKAANRVIAANDSCHGIAVRRGGKPAADDIAFTLTGQGSCFGGLVRSRDEPVLAGHVEFTGRPPDVHIVCIPSTAGIGLSPDPENQLKDVPTMSKLAEYMAFRPPVVTFDLRETRVSAGSFERTGS